MLSQRRQNKESKPNSLEQNKRLKMEGSSSEKEPHSETVLMPWEDRTEILVTKDDLFHNTTELLSRWDLIQMQLHTSRIISNVDDLISVIKSYNVTFGKDGRQMKSSWKCLALHHYFSNLEEFEKNWFFKDDGVLMTIRNLSLQLRDLVPKLQLLKIGFNSSVTLHQLQIASILSNAFLCTFPKSKADCPSINFNALFEGSSNSLLSCFVEKIKCIINYFKRIHKKQPSGNLSFHRLYIPDHKFPRWDKATADLCALKVEIEGKIEDQEGFLQMDFANRYVGGGVLGRGCVQEEIRFIICPELIAARLFTEILSDNEALFVIGAERYCRYKGYSNTFEFAGDYQDPTLYDENRRRKSYLIVLDALYFHHSSEQYRESKILRELKKAYVGFKPLEDVNVLPLATGNWGCGAFGGDPQLKTILQLMASSQARRNMLYLTFGNSVLKNQIDDLYRLLKEKSVNIGMLYRIIRLYNRERRKNQTVFDFIRESIIRPEKRKFTPVLNSLSNSRQRTPSVLEFKVLSEEEMTSMEESCNCKEQDIKYYSKKGKTVEENFPELNIDFEVLDKEIGNRAVLKQTISPREDNQLIDKNSSTKSKEKDSTYSQSILDHMWFENEIGCSITAKRKCNDFENSEKMDTATPANSPCLLSEDGDGDTHGQRDQSNSQSNEDFDMFNSFQSQNSTERSFVETGKSEIRKTEEKRNTQAKKFVQKKITDCLFKR